MNQPGFCRNVESLEDLAPGGTVVHDAQRRDETGALADPPIIGLCRAIIGRDKNVWALVPDPRLIDFSALTLIGAGRSMDVGIKVKPIYPSLRKLQCRVNLNGGLFRQTYFYICLLYTSDAADEMD